MLIKNNLFCSLSDPQVLSTSEALIRMLARIILLGEKKTYVLITVLGGIIVLGGQKHAF